MTPADYCEAMARWWRDASAGDAPVASDSIEAVARAAFREEYATVGPSAALADGGVGEIHAAVWDRAAAQLRAHALHAAADAAEETTR